MEHSKSSNEKINQYGEISLYIFLIVLTCVGAFCVIYKAYNWEIGKNDFTNWLIACGTIASAFGLIWFSYLTYKNQQNNEFQSLFNTLLNEHNRLLKDIDQNKLSKDIDKKELDVVNQSIIDFFYNIHNQDEFEENVSKFIDAHINFKPYLITLFRLLKLIKLSTKIRDDDKREYYGLVRALIPADMLFLILFNSLKHREKGKYPNYVNLLIEAKLFEHLPVTKGWLSKIYIGSEPDRLDSLRETLHTDRSSILINYIFSGDLINQKA